jgi:hypothetical protein
VKAVVDYGDVDRTACSECFAYTPHNFVIELHPGEHVIERWPDALVETCEKVVDVNIVGERHVAIQPPLLGILDAHELPNFCVDTHLVGCVCQRRPLYGVLYINKCAGSHGLRVGPDML